MSFKQSRPCRSLECDRGTTFLQGPLAATQAHSLSTGGGEARHRAPGRGRFSWGSGAMASGPGCAPPAGWSCEHPNTPPTPHLTFHQVIPGLRALLKLSLQDTVTPAAEGQSGGADVLLHSAPPCSSQSVAPKPGLWDTTLPLTLSPLPGLPGSTCGSPLWSGALTPPVGLSSGHRVTLSRELAPPVAGPSAE